MTLATNVNRNRVVSGAVFNPMSLVTDFHLDACWQHFEKHPMRPDSGCFGSASGVDVVVTWSASGSFLRRQMETTASNGQCRSAAKKQKQKQEIWLVSSVSRLSRLLFLQASGAWICGTLSFKCSTPCTSSADIWLWFIDTKCLGFVHNL